MQVIDTTIMAENEDERKNEPLGEGERGEWNVDLKLNIHKTKIMACGPITSWK